jgi:hypothetical protein
LANNVITHALIRSFVTEIDQFAKKTRHIVATGLPALEKVGEIRIESAYIRTTCGLRKRGSLQPSAHRAVAYSHPFSNGSLTHAELGPRNHLLIRGQALFSPCLLKTLHLSWMFFWRLLAR